MPWPKEQNENRICIDLWRMKINFDDESKSMEQGSPITINMTGCSNEISVRIVLRTIIGLEAQIKDRPSDKSKILRVKINNSDIRSFLIPDMLDPENIKSYIRENKLYQTFLRMK